MRAAFLALALVACSTSKTAEHDLHEHQDQQLAAGVALRIDSAETAKIDEHSIDTSGPGGELFEWYGPDGGVTARRERFWGPRVIEGWQSQEMGADEHVQIDAGVIVDTTTSLDDHDKLIETSKPDGCLALNAGLWLALVGVGLLGLVWFRRKALLAVCKRLVGIGVVLVGFAAAGQTIQPQRPGTSAPTAMPVQGVNSGVAVKVTCPDGTCSGGGGGGGLTDTQLRATPVPVSGSGTFDISDRVGRALGIVTIGAGAATIGKVDQGAAGASAWLVTGTGGTFPISGSIGNTSFGATQGTSPWVTADNHTTAAVPLSLRLSDGAAFYSTNTAAQLPSALVGGRLDVNVGAALPAGANVIGHVITDTGSTTVVTGTSTNNVSQWNGTTVDTNSGVKSAGTVRVVLATDQPALTNKLLVTPDSVALPANQSVNVTQWNGTTAVTGSGNATGALRVELANNGTGLVSLNAGSAIVGKFGIDQTTPGTTNGVQVNAALPAGTNIVGKVGIDQTTMGTTNGVVNLPTTVAGGATTTKVVAVNTTTNVKASAGNVYGMSCLNANASACFIQFYNTAGSPTCGTAVVWYIAMPTSGVVQIPPGALALANHTTGIGVCMGTTATGGTACTTANSCTFFYQ